MCTLKYILCKRAGKEARYKGEQGTFKHYS